MPESLRYESKDYQIHPAFLDACLQVLNAQGHSAEHDLYIPTGCKLIRIFLRPDHLIWSHVSLQSAPASAAGVISADIRLLDERNQIVAEFIGFQLQRIARRVHNLHLRQDTWSYQLRWQPTETAISSLSTLRQSRHWLIFADDESLGEELAKRLEAGGDSCSVLLSKEAIKKRGKAEGAFIQIIEKHLKEMPSPLYGIIHLWSLSI